MCEHVLLGGGMRCDSCGVCADEGCMRRADKRLKCKQVSIDAISMKHQWVKGKEPVTLNIFSVFQNVLNGF